MLLPFIIKQVDQHSIRVREKRKSREQKQRSVPVIEPAARATTSSGHNRADKDLINGLINTVNKQKEILKQLPAPDQQLLEGYDQPLAIDYSVNGRYLALKKQHNTKNMTQKELMHLAGIYGLDREYQQHLDSQDVDLQKRAMSDYGYGSEDIPDLMSDVKPEVPAEGEDGAAEPEPAAAAEPAAAEAEAAEPAVEAVAEPAAAEEAAAAAKPVAAEAAPQKARRKGTRREAGLYAQAKKKQPDLLWDEFMRDRHGDGRKKQDEGGMYDDQIDRVMSHFKDYKGTIMRNEIKTLLPGIEPRSRVAFIINNQANDKPGQHWDAVYIDARDGPESSNSLEWYDSFGRSMPPDILQDCKLILKMLKPSTVLKLKENRVIAQSDNSTNCGFFCCKFLMDRFRGKSFAAATGYDDKQKINEITKNEKEIENLKRTKPFSFIFAD